MCGLLLRAQFLRGPIWGHPGVLLQVEPPNVAQTVARNLACPAEAFSCEYLCVQPQWDGSSPARIFQGNLFCGFRDRGRVFRWWRTLPRKYVVLFLCGTDKLHTVCNLQWRSLTNSSLYRIFFHCNVIRPPRWTRSFSNLCLRSAP